ncbi:CYTH domain-containing protein [Candidatus Saccharibacteria bacterium]|nr:CYTH domain-containing protein [Candidatus Saccharibacteria bacterium]MBR2989671.1 CYTH domain-containing protein [Candidatus Saccharibacteria bacterium]
MKRVTIKVKVKDIDEFEKRVKDINLEFEPTLYQHDRVYVPRGYQRGMNLPRLVMRTEMSSVDKPAIYKLILKRHIEDSGIEITDRSVIRDYTEIVNMIHQLGFVLATEVSRRRRRIKLSDTSRIYLDKVDKLDSYYVKIETALEEKDKVSEVMSDLKRTLKLFHLSSKEISQESYFEMLKKSDIIDSKNNAF